jgi:hypothetical protein
MGEDKGTLVDPNMAIGNLDVNGDFIPTVIFSGSRSSIHPLDPVASFIPPTTGVYIVAVGSDIPQGTGTYTLEVAPSGTLFGSSSWNNIYSF